MPLDLVTVPCLSDNYAFLLHDSASGQTALVDVPEAAPILAALDERGWSLDLILLTHHHDDHVMGLDAVKARFDAPVYGAAADAHRLPPLDRELRDGDSFDFAGITIDVLDVSGHTLGHIAFHAPAAEAVFTGDSLMALGCGRLFEGTPEMMWQSLSKLAALPGDPWVCSGHEYTAANARFALTIEPGSDALLQRAAEIDAARSKDVPTVPSRLSVERATNPFLRASDPGVKDTLNMSDAPDSAVFAEIRGRKDRF